MKREPHHKDETKMEQLVVFQLQEQDYAVNIFSVQEIIHVGYITRVPRTPSYIKGIINLRGKIIPVIDLNKRFHFGREMASTGEERIIVVEVQGAVMGIMVDAVTQVLNVPQSQVAFPPAISEGKVAGLLKAVVPLDDRIIMVLDLEKVFSTLEKDHIA